MALDARDLSRHLRSLFGQYEDSFQEAWLEILERNPQTITEITPIVRKVRNRAITQYLNKKYREESLHRPLGRNGDGNFTLESILEDPSSDENADSMDEDGSDSTKLYKKIVDFLIGDVNATVKGVLEGMRGANTVLWGNRVINNWNTIYSFPDLVASMEMKGGNMTWDVSQNTTMTLYVGASCYTFTMGLAGGNTTYASPPTTYPQIYGGGIAAAW